MQVNEISREILQHARKIMRQAESIRQKTASVRGLASGRIRVGYDNASHFSREYKSLFGNPPMRDAEQLREVVSQSS